LPIPALIEDAATEAVVDHLEMETRSNALAVIPLVLEPVRLV
jgi:hypothetical protein